MAKQNYNTVDERELLSLISGGQQPYKPPEREAPKEPEDHPAKGIQPEPDVKPQNEKAEKIPKKRRQGERPEEKDYDGVFLARTQSAQRCQTYIDRETYSLIKSFLPVIAPEICIAAYINNILADHLDEYWDTINERYNAARTKPLARR